MVGVIATPAFGYVSHRYNLDPAVNPEELGKWISAMTIIPCALSIPLFLIGGCKYRNFKVKDML